MTGLAQHYIAGLWRDDGARPRPSVNPADDTPLGRYVPGNAALADEAATAARAAFDDGLWAASPGCGRSCCMNSRTGLPRRRMTSRIWSWPRMASSGRRRWVKPWLASPRSRYYAGLARNIRGSMQEMAPGQISLFHREAAGVAGIIVPWNAPVTLLVRSLAPALAAGCTAVIKPAAQTPLVHARVMQCLAECPSLPAGVINSVNENGIEVGQAMVASPLIDVISFTGSSRTGRKIMEGAAATLKRVGLELGGKAPSVIFEDADLDLAVRRLTHGSLAIAGQMCAAAARFLVHDSVAADFAERMTAGLKAVRVGPGADPSSGMGALIDTANQARLMRLIEQAGDEGRMMLKGGPLETGAFLTPTLFGIDDVRSPLVQEELFGPIISFETFGDEAEAVAKANATVYGLAASVFTRDHARAMRMSRAIRAGTVWINAHLRLFAEAETGGYGQSGLGRLHGPEGLHDFLETKHIFMEPGVA
ncbi:aldehyde dehydrogenase family protein [Rhodophyticola porphyridii]|uniref:aldehyde dehydrogenase family protein n=1 Tax=Rhodophyticola porphyridii TaxID=1852017 RepID=UPI0035D1190B